MARMGEHEGKMGGGRHGSGHSSKNEKPGYMGHIPDHHLKTGVSEHHKASRMTADNISGYCGGGSMGHEEEA